MANTHQALNTGFIRLAGPIFALVASPACPAPMTTVSIFRIPSSSLRGATAR